MTAAGPDARFRDQLAEDLALAYSGRSREAFDAAPAEWRQAWFDDTEALVPVVEARVQAAANQRAAVVGRCGNCDAITDTLPCPFCAAAKQRAAEELRAAADEFDSRLPDGTGNGRAYNSYRVAAMLRVRAAALASPAPAPRAEH